VSAPAFAAAVRAIAFDAGNTLLWIDHARVARIVSAAGAAVDEQRVREAEMRARPRLDPMLGRVPKRESPHVFRAHVQFTLEHLDIADADVIARATAGITAVWSELWCRPPGDAHTTVAALRERGYQVSCLSNSNGKVSRLLERADLLALLDDVVDSGAVGVEKPEPRIFEIAAERLGLAPSEMVYIGDLHALDVLGPHRVGMHAILLDPIDVWPHAAAPRVRALADLLEWFPGPPA
jgi:HAD superfamily hydrolase (TIGR01509 family)